MGSALLASLAVSQGYPYSPPGPSGAARFRSYIWPDPIDLAQNAGGVHIAPGGRGFPFGNGGPGMIVSSYGNGTTTGAVQNGIMGWQATCGSTGGVGYRMQGNILTLKTTPLLGLSPNIASDDCHAMRVWANLACSQGATPGNDQGFFMVHPGGTAQRIFFELALGFGFSIGNSGVVQWVVRGPNGLFQYNVTASPFDITKLHTYEIWILGAPPGGVASLIPLIDGVPCLGIPNLSRTWGPGSNLQPNVTISGEINFAPQVTADGKVLNQTVLIQQVGIALGPTLSAVA